MSKKLQTLKLNTDTLALLRSKSRELKITQSALIYYSISKLTDEDVKVINKAKELVYG